MTHTGFNKHVIHLQRLYLKNNHQRGDGKKYCHVLITKKSQGVDDRVSDSCNGQLLLYFWVCVCDVVNSPHDARCSHTLAVWFDSPRRAGWPGISVTFRGATMLTYCSLSLSHFPRLPPLPVSHSPCYIHLLLSVLFTSYQTCAWLICVFVRPASTRRSLVLLLVFINRNKPENCEAEILMESVFYTGSL